MNKIINFEIWKKELSRAKGTKHELDVLYMIEKFKPDHISVRNLKKLINRILNE